MRNEQVGHLLKELRIKNNLTQKELAEKVGVTYQAVSRWEKGINTPNLETLIALKQLYHVSVDELLLEVKSTIEDTSIELHWVFKFFLFPIGFFILSFCITQFYFFLNTEYAMTIVALFMMVIETLIIGFIKIKNRTRFYLILFGSFLLFTGLIYGLNFYYFNQTQVPYLMAVDSEVLDIEISDQMPIYIRYSFDDQENLLMYHKTEDKIYLFNLNSAFDSMLTTIDTNNQPVMSVTMIDNLIYYSTYDPYINACEIYSVNLNTAVSEFVFSANTNYDLLSDGTNLYLVTRYEPIVYREDSIYKLNNQSIELVVDFDFKIHEIFYSEFYESFYLSVINSDPLKPNEFGNILIYNNMFDFQHAIFSEYQQDIFKIKDDGSKIISTYQDELIRILYTDVEMTGVNGIVDDIHNTSGVYYTYSGSLLDSQWNELNSNAFVLSNWRQGSGHFIFERFSDGKYINFEQNEVTILATISRQIESIAIPNYYRHAMMFTSLPFLALLVTYGCTLKKK